MTPEEKALTLVEGHNPLHGDGLLFHKGEMTALLGAQLVRSIAQAIREAKIEAYEEVITIAGGWDSASNGNHARSVADDVRALRDSLVPEVAAS